MRILNAGAALVFAVLFSVIGVGASKAAVVESFDNGWYNSNNGFTAGVSNIYVGWNPNTGATYNNWLAFNLAAFAGQAITSATLTFYGGNGTYGGTDPSETLGLFNYAGSINALVGDQQFRPDIYNDLGTGASYGTKTISSGPLQQFSVTLTAEAITALNAAANNPSDQRFVIGGSLLSVAAIHDSSNYYTDGALFVANGPTPALEHAAFLSLEVSPVPLPGALVLFGSGLGGLAMLGYAKRRRKHA